MEEISSGTKGSRLGAAAREDNIRVRFPWGPGAAPARCPQPPGHDDTNSTAVPKDTFLLEISWKMKKVTVEDHVTLLFNLFFFYVYVTFWF